MIVPGVSQTLRQEVMEIMHYVESISREWHGHQLFCSNDKLALRAK